VNRPGRPAPEPLDVDVVSVVAVGTALWFVAFLVMLPLRGRLAEGGHANWFWTSLAGWVLGLLGIVVARAQRAARARAEQAARQAAAGPSGPADRGDRAGRADDAGHAGRGPAGDGGAGEPHGDGGRYDAESGRHGDGRTG
jgi:hypothetical protein